MHAYRFVKNRYGSWVRESKLIVYLKIGHSPWHGRRSFNKMTFLQARNLIFRKNRPQSLSEWSIFKN
jgi:hypothetical protein